MEKFLICIPSRNRAEKLFKNTYSFVQHSKYPFKIFVEPSQQEQYLEFFDKSLLVIMKENNKGLCYAKKEMMEYALENGIEFILKMDDDINNIRVREISEIKKTENVDRAYRAKYFLDVAIKESLEVLKDFDEIKAVGYFYGQELREENAPTWISLNSRLQGTYIIKTKFLFPSPEHIKSDGFEDFSTFFNIVDSGFFTIRHGKLGFDYKPTGVEPGGLQDFNRREIVNKSKEYLSNKYPYLKWKSVNKSWDWEPDIRATKEFHAIKL